jgi:hemerythrin-like domain-containing protein
MAQDILEMIKSDHEKTMSDLKRIMSRAGEVTKSKRNEEFDRMHLELNGHMTAEEKIFYPALESEIREQISHAREEHEEIRSSLKDIGRSWSETSEFTQKLQKLEETINHHVEEEEEKIFTTARESLGQDRLQEMGSRFEEEKRKTVQRGLAPAR